MRLPPMLYSLLTLVAVVSARVTIGEACSGSGYDCTVDSDAVAVCNGRQWVLAAQCGTACCVWPGTPAPYCSC